MRISLGTIAVIAAMLLSTAAVLPSARHSIGQRHPANSSGQPGRRGIWPILELHRDGGVVVDGNGPRPR